MHPPFNNGNSNGNSNNLSSQNLWKSSKNTNRSVDPKNNDHNAYINKSNWNFPTWSRITVEICMTFSFESSHTIHCSGLLYDFFCLVSVCGQCLFCSFGRGYFSIKFFPSSFVWFLSFGSLRANIKKKSGTKPKMSITLHRLYMEYAIRLLLLWLYSTRILHTVLWV